MSRNAIIALRFPSRFTRYLLEVPRQARVTHLVRCFSRFSAAHAEILFGIYGEGNTSLGLESRDASSLGPTSTILLSPDATDRHPFYAISAASAGVSGVSPALSASSLRPTPRHLAFDILPARRYAPLAPMSPPFRPSLAASRLDFRASAADLNMGLATPMLTIVSPLGNVRPQASLSDARLRRSCRRMMASVSTPARHKLRPSVSENAGDSPRKGRAQALRRVHIRVTSLNLSDFSNHILWAILVSASAWLTVLAVWLTISATTMPGLQSDINVLFPSDRASRTRGFSIRSKVPSAQLCLRARDFIQLGRSRVYAETVDEAS
ncbi:hypothetical protein EDB83DRAFT_2533410 [Lactarius deliciosus]|nr:hypothetical protein EDB83DRAFT_2533410 [Lactarius deliciosus]